MKKIKKGKLNFNINFHITGPVIIFALIVFNVLLAIQSGSLGSVLLEFEKEERLLLTNNRELMSQQVYETSLSRIESESEKIGMVEPERIIYLNREKPVANAN